MSYNTDLQTNNTDLNKILTSVNELFTGGFYTTETWELTMSDNNVEEIQVKNVKMCTVHFFLGPDITKESCSCVVDIKGSPWGSTHFIRQGDTLKAVLSSGDATGYLEWDSVGVDMCTSDGGGMGIGAEYDPDKNQPWLVYISEYIPEGFVRIDVSAETSDII